MHSPSSALVLALLVASVVGNPVVKRIREPAKDTPLANLEGLPSCYGKCMISKAPWYNHDMFTETFKDWCKHYDGGIASMTSWWSETFAPCLSKDCPPTEVYLPKWTNWAQTHCPPAIVGPTFPKPPGAPDEGAVLALLEGLPACYAKCFISEAHWAWPFDLYTKSMKGFCAYPAVIAGYWYDDHMMVCVEHNCEPHNANIIKGSMDWQSAHCPNA